MKNLALFDFDGTITTRDTLIEFILFTHGPVKALLGFFILSPFLVLMKLKLYPNWRAKEKVLSWFYKGKKESELKADSERFVKNVVPKLIRNKALVRIEEHIKNEDTVYVVSASPEIWVDLWAKRHGLKSIGTRLELNKNGTFTGKISGKNCYGPEKVNRINEVVNLESFDRIYAYGDSRGDKELLSVADYPYFKKF